MWGIFIFSIISVCMPFGNSFRGFLVGPGTWLVREFHKCDNSDEYEISIDIKIRKATRTLDYYDSTADLAREFNDTYAVEIELYQEVDGGFKYHQTIKHDSLCKIFKETAEEDYMRFLTMAKIDPPVCLIPPGHYVINNFVMDYENLPKIGLYGTFETRLYVIYDKKKVGCVRSILNFEIRDDEDDGDGTLPDVASVLHL